MLDRARVDRLSTGRLSTGRDTGCAAVPDWGGLADGGACDSAGEVEVDETTGEAIRSAGFSDAGGSAGPGMPN